MKERNKNFKEKKLRKSNQNFLKIERKKRNIKGSEKYADLC